WGGGGAGCCGWPLPAFWLFPEVGACAGDDFCAWPGRSERACLAKTGAPKDINMMAIADRRRKRFKNAALVLCGLGCCRDLAEQMVIYQVSVQPRGYGRLVPRLNKIA